MVFNSYTFILFLGAVLVGMRSRLSWRQKKLMLLLGSYVFYAAWNPPFVMLIWLSTAVDFWVCRRLATSASHRKLLLMVSLITNLGLLGFFKYGDFLLENFVIAAAAAGIEFHPAPLGVILPVGISFYTFQTLSYTIDVYRGRLEPSYSLLDFALFVTFFPQLVAGPIVRAADFLPQTLRERRPSSAEMGWGLSLITLGLFQKVVLADSLLAPVAERIFDSTASPSPLSTGIGTLAFAGQIFCDFSGYSTIAIGSAMLLGFRLPDNFRCPYAAIGFSDFWQRWHISLSSWLRDYLYISLGGNRYGRARTYRNLMLTMLLGGLWHGASWNFVIWGGLHGLYLVAERLARELFQGWRLWSTTVARVILAGVTFGLVNVAWIFFRAPTLERSIEMLNSLLFLEPRELFVSSGDQVIVLTVMAGLLVAHALLRNTTIEAAASRLPVGLRVLGVGAMLAAIFMSPTEDRAFIYFQF